MKFPAFSIAREQKPHENWQSWPTLSEALSHAGQQVEVMRFETNKIILRGTVTTYTDLLGGSGICEFGSYGLDKSGGSVIAALKFPKKPEAFNEWTKQLRFRLQNTGSPTLSNNSF